MCSVIGGMKIDIGIRVSKPNTPKTIMGMCQSDKSAKNKPSGTPTTDATENAAITIPVTPALRSLEENL